VLDIDALNNTKRADREVLFFNRVPKVGSQTFMELLRRLSMRNAFSFNRDRVQRVETIRLAPIEQVRRPLGRREAQSITINRAMDAVQ